MAKMVGVWMYVAPRDPSDDVNLTGAATIILSEAERRQLGDGLMTVSLRVRDDDTFGDDTVYQDDSFQLGPANLNVGPNTFGLSAVVPRSSVVNTEPGWESSAELYFRVRASGGGITTNWANSQTEDVPYA